MSTTAAATSKLRTFTKWSLISLVLIVLTWSAVILWWQTTQRVVSTYDIVLWLVALPAIQLAAIAFLTRGSSRNNQPGISIPEQPAAPAPFNRHADDNPSPLPILNTWAVTGHASSAEELLQVLVERRIRPQPDPELTDDEGFPILAGRVAGLDTARVEQWLARATVAGSVGYPSEAEQWRAAFIRSLALLAAVADQLAPDCAHLADALDRHSAMHDESAATLRAAPRLPAENAASFQLNVTLMLPAGFHPPEKQAALDYLVELLPFPRLPNLHVELAPATDAVTAFTLLNRFKFESQRRGNPQALLLLACDSMLCPAVLEEWQASSRMFSTRYPNGLMAGEAAFGLLCANDAALDVLPIGALCRLDAASLRERELSADTPGKPSYSALADAVHEALEHSGTPSDQVGTVVCDTDHRTNRVLECIGAMMSHTPHLDAIQNRLAVNEACGHLGAATGLGILTAGVQRAMSEALPVLLFNVGHATERAAAILLPASET